MYQYEKQLLEALRAFLWKGEAKCILNDGEQWESLWQIATEQKVVPMAADVLLKSYKEQPGNKERAKVIRNMSVANVMDQTMREQAFFKVYSGLTDSGLKPLVVKGAVCRKLYPKGEHRSSSDEDLLVRPQEFEKASQLLKSLGMEVCSADGESEQVVSYFGRGTGLYLEVHRTLFSESSEAYGNFNSYFEDAFDKAVEEQVQGNKIWTLCPQEHMLYLVLHSFKHFLHSGFGIRQVCDICLYANEYSGDIDWPVLLDKLKTVKADIFTANLFQIGKKHLGFKSYPAAVEQILSEYSESLDCTDMLEDLLRGGIYGGNSLARRHSSRITLNAVTSKQSSSRSRLLRTVFPKKSELEGTYTYLQKHPYFLPAAWAQRIGGYLVRDRRKSGKAQESVGIGESRVKLLKKYQVIP